GHRQAPPGRAALVRDGDLGDRGTGPGTAHPGRVLPADAGADRPQPRTVRLAAAVVRVAQRARGQARSCRQPLRAVPGLAELQADPQPATAGSDGTSPGVPAPGLPLQVSFNRIKTSMEVRRTKRMGGHLPSAAKSNSMPVLFRNYLSGDPVITAWAAEVLGEALLDAEQAARQAHERAARAAGGGPRVVPGPAGSAALEASGLAPDTARQVADGDLDTGWTACADHNEHPLIREPCQVTFLDCFHCGNCLVTRDHLPRLLALLDALAQRRRELPEKVWWPRYGPA